MTSQDLARLLSLNAAETLELLGLDAHTLAEADLASGTTNERGTVGVERLVDRGGARLGAGHRDTLGLSLSGGGSGGFVTVAEVLDDSRLHSELDPVERHEPYNVLEKEIRLDLCRHNESIRRLTQTQTIPIQPPEME